MKKSKINILSLSSILVMSLAFTSCVSTTVDSITSDSVMEENQIITEKEQIISDKPSKEEKDFIKNLDNISIKIENFPRFVTVHNDFVRPFSIAVTDNNGKPVPNFPITIKYPGSKVDGELVYTTENYITDENGKYAYTAKTPTFSALGDFSVYPTPISDNKKVTEAAELKSASTPWKVRSQIVNREQIMFVKSYTERVAKDYRQLLSKLKQEGIRVGNGPYSGDPSYLKKPIKEVYNAHYELVGNSFGFIIFGTVDFIEPVTDNEDGTKTCKLIADIQTIKMADGSVPFHETFTHEVTKQDSWWNVVELCQEELADKITEALLYKMD